MNCVVCGGPATYIEPRFGYSVCPDHEGMRPVDIRRERAAQQVEKERAKELKRRMRILKD